MLSLPLPHLQFTGRSWDLIAIRFQNEGLNPQVQKDLFIIKPNLIKNSLVSINDEHS